MATTSHKAVTPEQSIEIVPYYCEGDPSNIMHLSLARAKALAGALASYHLGSQSAGLDDDALYMLAAMIDDHIDIAQQAMERLDSDSDGDDSELRVAERSKLDQPPITAKPRRQRTKKDAVASEEIEP